MKYPDFFKNFNGYYDKFSFANKHGENFIVARTKFAPHFTFITGDEYDWEVTQLFNDQFDVYSDEELKQIGKALQAIATKQENQ